MGKFNQLLMTVLSICTSSYITWFKAHHKVETKGTPGIILSQLRQTILCEAEYSS